MNEKISLLFVIDSLNIAGAEKSLVTLLNMLNYSKFNVDLMLFGHGGELEKLVPDKATILEPLKYMKFSKLNIKDATIFSLKHKNLSLMSSRFKYSFGIRKRKYSNPEKARIFWESVAGVIENNPKLYDIAISYAQGIPTFYTAKKVTAKNKFAWVNVSYRLNETEKSFQKKYYDQFNKIVAVSDSTKDVFIKTFPKYKNKIDVIYDINNPGLISSMAEIGEGYTDGFDGIKILTIGRLANQKGYNLALEACKLLKDKGIYFRWYVIGKGPLEEKILQYIKEHDLTTHFVLLGTTANPYPYIKNSDIYVQTSKYEGFGIAIAEARMLNVPIVTTRFDAVFNQMIHEKNGLVVDMNANAVYKGILELITNSDLRKGIKEYLSKEKKGNPEEIEKFYRLIDDKVIENV